MIEFLEYLNFTGQSYTAVSFVAIVMSVILVTMFILIIFLSAYCICNITDDFTVYKEVLVMIIIIRSMRKSTHSFMKRDGIKESAGANAAYNL